MASRDFGLVRYEFKRVDGKGKVLAAYQTPSAFVRATRVETDGPFEAAALLAYYSASAAGILGQMEVESTADGGSDLDRALALLDAYQFREVPLDDDGKPVADGKAEAEPDPTGPRTPASAS